MVPALPLPATRSREPCCAPGGIRTSTVSVVEMRPSPWQVGHAFCKRPVAVAARAGQTELHRAGHLGHVAAAVALRADGVAAALAAPVPLQVAHTSWRVMFRRTCVPRIACQKSMFRPYSRSEPFSGAVRGCLAAACRPNHWLKIS